jgi:O-antigen ligase
MPLSWTIRLPPLLLCGGLLFGWLLPNRGGFDLNQFPELAVALAAGFAILGHVIVRAPGRWTFPGTASAVFGTLAACLLLTLVRGVAPYPDTLLLPFGALLVGLVTLWLSADIARDATRSRQADALLYGTTVLGGLLTAYAVFAQAGLITWFTGWIILPPDGVVPFGNFYQRNLAAVLMVLACGACLLWPGVSWRGGSALLRAGAALVLLLAITLTASRAGMLLLAATGGYCAWVQTSGAPPWRRVSWALIGLLATLGASFLAQSIEPWLLRTQAPLPTAGERLAEGQGFGLRLAIMRHGLEQWADHPWFGGGWGTHAGWLFEHALTLEHPRYSTNTHNLITQLLGEAGLIAVLLVIGFGIRSLRGVPAALEQPQRDFGSLHVMVVGVLLMHSMLEYPLWNLFFLVPFCWAWARLGPAHRAASDRATSPAVARSMGAAGMVLVAASLALAVVVVRIVEARHTIEAMRRGETAGVNTAGLAAQLRVPGLSPFSDLLLYAALPLSTDQVDGKLALGARVIRYAPEWWLMERQAMLAVIAGRSDEAVGLLARACAMHRTRCDEITGRIDQLAQQEPALFAAVRDGLRKRRSELGLAPAP